MKPKSEEVSQVELGRRLGLDQTTVGKILRRVPGQFAPATVERVLALAKKMGYTSVRQHRPYVRRHPRHLVRWPVTVYLVTRTKVTHRGRAVLVNVSQGGAYLTDLTLSPPCVPLAPHTWHLRPTKGPKKGVTLVGTLTRLSHQGTGVKWESELVWQ